MFPFRRILFPVDYSHPCEAVVPYVREMVRHFDAQLTVLHARTPESLAYGEFPTADPDWPAKVHAFEEERLRKFACNSFPTIPVEMRVMEGDPAGVIHKFVEHEGTDLVMMPTSGHGPVRRLLVGSITAKVLHDISAAVWTGVGKAIEGHVPSHMFQSILCALDETDEAEAVLRAAANLAESSKARLFLLHAVASPPMALEVDFNAYRKELMDSADFNMRELKKKLGVDAPHKVTGMMMLDAIREEAIRRKVDLLVVGRGESQGMLGRLWSRLYPLIREAPCPVLSI
jgi:nucleotide-binding universal stress UspA family protein